MTLQEISAWTKATFGDANQLRIATRALEEFSEFMGAIADHEEIEDIVTEAADVIIVLAHFAGVAGVDLQAAIDRKMAVNLARKWNVKNGVGYHVKDDQAESAKEPRKG